MKRHELLLAATPLVVCLALVGCQSGSYEAHYELRVTEAVVEDGIPESGPGTEEIAVRVTWSADEDGLVASFTNPADTTAAIHWDEATISFDDEPPQPLLSTAPHPNPDLPQAPTLIPKYGQMIIGMLPESSAEWEWFSNRAMGGSWHPTSALFGITLNAEQSASDREALAETAVGRKIMIELPVRTGSRRLTHIYDLRVKRAEVRASYQ